MEDETKKISSLTEDSLNEESASAANGELPIIIDLESFESVDTIITDKSPAEDAPVGSKPKRVRSKLLQKYKAALRTVEAWKERRDLSNEEQLRLTQAKAIIESGREHFRTRPDFAAKDPSFHNRIDEEVLLAMTKNRNQSFQGETTPQTAMKRKAGEGPGPQPERKKPTPSPSNPHPLSNVVKKRLTVALIDANHICGRISGESWKIVEKVTAVEIAKQLINSPSLPLPSFDSLGWQHGVKLIRCKDEQSVEWLRRTVPRLTGLWEGAALQVVDKNYIPVVRTAKVTLPVALQANLALELLRKQNPDIPTKDWKVLKAMETREGQTLILRISKESEDKLYSLRGKMSFGVSNVFLRLKNRSDKDGNENTFAVDEIEKDLGLEAMTDTDTCIVKQELSNVPRQYAGVADKPAAYN